MKGILGDEAFVKSEHRIPINRKEDGVTRPMRAGIQKAIAYIKENYGSGAELKKAYDAKMSGKAGKGEQVPAAPEAPRGPVDKEVVKEQAANKMYEVAARGLGARGYPVDEISQDVMSVIRKNLNSPIFDPSTTEGRKNIWAIIKKELNIAYPKK